MQNGKGVELVGTVVKSIKGGKFEVSVNDTEFTVICTLAGKLRLNKIYIQEQDTVTIEVSEYDLTKGRITWRGKRN